MSAEWLEYYIDEIKAAAPSSIAIGPFGSRMKSDCYVESGVRVVRGTNLTSGMGFSGEFVFVTSDKAAELGGANLEPFDLVFPHLGAIGEVGIVPDDGKRYVLSSSLMKLRCDRSKADPQFIFYFFKSAAGRFELLKNASQVGTPGIGQPLTSLKGIRLKLPMIEEQQRIAGVLGALDDRIALLHETNTTLEAMAQALFKSWFVDFDPVHANAGTRAATLPAELQALFPSTFTDTPKGLVPEGWRMGRIYDVATVTYGAPFASKQFNTEQRGQPLIRIRDLKDEKPGVYTEEVHPKGYLTQPGDIVVGMDGEFRAYLWGGEPAWLNQRVCVFKPKAGYSSAFVNYMIKPQLAAVEATEIATTVIHLGKNDIDRFVALIPSDSVLSAFSEVANPIFAQIVEGKQKAQTLAALRDTLLPRLISGQLRLPDAAVALAEAGV